MVDNAHLTDLLQEAVEETWQGKRKPVTDSSESPSKRTRTDCEADPSLSEEEEGEPCSGTVEDYERRKWVTFGGPKIEYENGKKKPRPPKGHDKFTLNTPEEVRWPHRGMTCIGTGARSDLTVIDFDSMAAYETVVDALPSLKDAYTVETRKGRHIYFKHAGLRNRTNALSDIAGTWRSSQTYTTAASPSPTT